MKENLRGRKEKSIMRKELEYFYIGKAYGGNQEWFFDAMMRIGGCAAVTACDSCIYFACSRGEKKYYPFGTEPVKKRDYRKFSRIMKPYLTPRKGGIDRLSIYIEGYGAYLRDRGIKDLSMEPFDGNRPGIEAFQKVKEQIDRGMPVPYLLLRHQDAELKDFVWHWFLLTGYEEEEKGKKVKAVSYGEWKWLDFERLWNTGQEPKGGMILYNRGIGN